MVEYGRFIFGDFENESEWWKIIVVLVALVRFIKFGTILVLCVLQETKYHLGLKYLNANSTIPSIKIAHLKQTPSLPIYSNNYQRSRAIKCAGGRVVGIRLTQKARISIIYDRFTPLRRNSGATRHYRVVSRKRLLCIYDSRSQGDRLDFITHCIVYLFNTF